MSSSPRPLRAPYAPPTPAPLALLRVELRVQRHLIGRRVACVVSNSPGVQCLLWKRIRAGAGAYDGTFIGRTRAQHKVGHVLRRIVRRWHLM